MSFDSPLCVQSAKDHKVTCTKERKKVLSIKQRTVAGLADDMKIPHDLNHIV